MAEENNKNDSSKNNTTNNTTDNKKDPNNTNNKKESKNSNNNNTNDSSKNDSSKNNSNDSSKNNSNNSSKNSSDGKTLNLTFLGISILIFAMFLAVTEFVIDCSVRLNVLVLIITFLVALAPIISLFIADKNTAKTLCCVFLVIEIILLCYLAYMRNRLYAFYVQSPNFSDSDKQKLRNAFTSPSAVVVFLGPNAISDMSFYTRTNQDLYRFASAQKDPAKMRMMQEQLKRSLLSKRMTGIINKIILESDGNIGEDKIRQWRLIRIG